MSAPAIDIEDLAFAYPSGETVLDIERLSIPSGQTVFLHGPSGGGKTTLLGLLAGILPPRSGRVSLLGQDLSRLGAGARDRFRGVHIGYIFQMFNLIPYLNARENIKLPCRLNPGRLERAGGQDLNKAVASIAAALEIESLLDRPVIELSVGQQQRVAAARAFAGAPEIIIADEPTSALDTDLRDRFIELLLRTASEAGSTVVFVSHDRALRKHFDSSLALGELNRTGAVH